MGGRGSSSGKASGSAGANVTGKYQGADKNEMPYGAMSDVLNYLNNDDASRSDIRSGLETLFDGATVYTAKIDKSGELLGSNTIKKNSDDSYTINGKQYDKSEAVRYLYNNGYGVAQREAPDTSSHVKITGTRSETVDGVKMKAGTYDVYQSKGRTGADSRTYRKYEKSGKIATYDGTKYGITKSGGEYFTTHIPSGMLIGKGQKTLKGAVGQIKDVHSRLVANKDLSKQEKRFKNTLRG